MFVLAVCTCGWTWSGPELRWLHVSTRHVRAHLRGLRGSPTQPFVFIVELVEEPPGEDPPSPSVDGID
jgi:hypothetical protein